MSSLPNRLGRNHGHHRRREEKRTCCHAADTLTTFGNTLLPSHLDASHDKILHIGNSYVGVCGSTAHHPVLANLSARTPGRAA